MITNNPTVDELIREFPNLREAICILINGLKEERSPSALLYCWDEYRKQDSIEKGKVK
jgi:hypothetical protein